MAKTGVISASLRTEMHSAQAANSQPEPNDAFVELLNFVFDDGETLASLKLHYLTLGTPRRDASGAIANGVLLLHGPARDRLPIVFQPLGLAVAIRLSSPQAFSVAENNSTMLAAAIVSRMSLPSRPMRPAE